MQDYEQELVKRIYEEIQTLLLPHHAAQLGGLTDEDIKILESTEEVLERYIEGDNL